LETGRLQRATPFPFIVVARVSLCAFPTRNRAFRVVSRWAQLLKTEAPAEAKRATCAAGAARGSRTVEARNSPRGSSATRINNINSGIRLFVFAFEYQTHRVGVTNVRRRADSRSRRIRFSLRMCVQCTFYDYFEFRCAIKMESQIFFKQKKC